MVSQNGKVTRSEVKRCRLSFGSVTVCPYDLFISVNLNFFICKTRLVDFPGGAVVKNPPANAGDTGSRPSPGRSHMPWSS